ncbi:FAD-dependent oxidoreductase [Reichenbachiella sp. MALMAid0571]|uniref:NAD(P)/FAD-dependent oxidoreductase n=1 Tax=Reichenbachiella sp. MALMAid0571 TaxID=3143939 RepID=UPI0032DF2A38
MNSFQNGKSEVVVIGAGTIGCAITYYLAKKSVKVRLLERNTIGSGNTSLAASLLTKIRSKPDIIPLVQETYHAMDSLNDEIENKLDIQMVGSLHLAASDKSVEDLDQLTSIADDFNISHSYISKSEMQAMVPWLKTDEIIKASFMPDDAFMDAYVLTNAFAEAARKHGAVIQQYTNIEGLVQEGDCIKGVKTKDGIIECDYVVDAAGAWSNLLSLQVGIGLPVTPVRSNYWITSANPQLFPATQPIVILPDASAYTRPESGALLFGLRESKSVHFNPEKLPSDLTGYVFGDPEDRWNILLEQGERLQRFFPKFDEIEIAHYIAGVSTYTPDGMFVLGGLPQIKGFLAATGCSGAGVAVSGGMGRIISEIITGTNPYCDINPFKIDRFGALNPLSEEFRQRCADARSHKKSG